MIDCDLAPSFLLGFANEAFSFFFLDPIRGGGGLIGGNRNRGRKGRANDHDAIPGSSSFPRNVAL